MSLRHPVSPLTRRYALQHTATHCNTLQHSATHCNALQHTATRCNTLQHSFKSPLGAQLTTGHPATLCYTHCNTHCNTLHRTAAGSCVLQCLTNSMSVVNDWIIAMVEFCVTVCCSVLQYGANAHELFDCCRSTTRIQPWSSIVVSCVAVCCSMLQCLTNS